MNLKQILLLSLALFCFVWASKAAKVDTLNIPSRSMAKEIKTVVILPKGYSANTKYPVLYLLHGYSGNYSNWVKNTTVASLADQYGYMVVCPDGDLEVGIGIVPTIGIINMKHLFPKNSLIISISITRQSKIEKVEQLPD
ncbi:alpha/beta hydrolase-fold protein [Sphingobacterium sp. E70]|uniref:alpha/beta hydrolase-fold protein n=1 Tax=Sphingobacterium sp. E70 TaxID=2853439 RepID=UPI0027951FE4|nr:alpha/beta hydrolase-fold protein [Sphingobacterium sp. E70]